MESLFFVKRANHQYTRGCHKKISVSEVGVIFQGSSWIWAILGLFPIANISTLNFGPWPTKLGGTVRVARKTTHIDNGLGSGRITEKRPFYFLLTSGFRPQNPFFSLQKKHSESIKRLLFIWEKGTFFYAQLSLVVARTWCPFFAIRHRILSKACLKPSARWSHLRIDFSTFCFRVTAVFVKKKRPTRQKVFPLSTVTVCQ